MGLIDKLKLLFRTRQPINDLITELKEIKTGWKTWQFWMTLLPSVAALATALAGLLPASTILLVVTITTLITALYNIWRGAVKSQVAGQKPFLQTSEFWVSVVTCFSTAIIALQAGGINPAWFKTALEAIAVVLGSLGAGQNLSGQQPGAGGGIATPPTK